MVVPMAAARLVVERVVEAMAGAERVDEEHLIIAPPAARSTKPHIDASSSELSSGLFYYLSRLRLLPNRYRPAICY